MYLVDRSNAIILPFMIYSHRDCSTRPDDIDIEVAMKRALASLNESKRERAKG